MPDDNGTGRLDRIEKILEMFIADHERMRQEHERIRQEHERIRQEHERTRQEHQEFQEDFERDLKQLLIAQVLQNDEIEKLWKAVKEQTKQIELQRENGADLDRRISNLVSAIGKLAGRGTWQ